MRLALHWWKKPVVFWCTELKKKGNKLLVTGCMHVNSFNYVHYLKKKTVAAWCRLCWIPQIPCWRHDLHPKSQTLCLPSQCGIFFLLCFNSCLHLALLTFVLISLVPGELVVFSSSNQHCDSFMELGVRFISLIRIVRIPLWNGSGSLWLQIVFPRQSV